GSFAEFDPPCGANGHFIHAYPQLWTDTVATYLGALEADAPRAAVRPPAKLSTPQVPPAASADMLVDGVPIPSDASVKACGVPENLERFSGAWVGAWGGQLRHVLVVEYVMADGSANVVYAVGENPAANVRPQWHRLNATIVGNTLRVGRFATYELAGNG